MIRKNYEFITGVQNGKNETITFEEERKQQ
jgi:hypothetical protein